MIWHAPEIKYFRVILFTSGRLDSLLDFKSGRSKNQEKSKAITFVLKSKKIYSHKISPCRNSMFTLSSKRNYIVYEI